MRMHRHLFGPCAAAARVSIGPANGTRTIVKMGAGVGCPRICFSSTRPLPTASHRTHDSATPLWTRSSGVRHSRHRGQRALRFLGRGRAHPPRRPAPWHGDRLPPALATQERRGMARGSRRAGSSKSRPRGAVQRKGRGDRRAAFHAGWRAFTRTRPVAARLKRRMITEAPTLIPSTYRACHRRWTP